MRLLGGHGPTRTVWPVHDVSTRACRATQPPCHMSNGPHGVAARSGQSHHPIGVIPPPTCRSDGSEETSRPGAGHGIGPGRRIQFAVDALEMGFERVHRDEKLARDLSGAQTCL